MEAYQIQSNITVLLNSTWSIKKNIRWKKIDNYYIGKKKNVGFELKTLRSVADVWTYSATLINIKITKGIHVIVFNQLSLILLTIFRKEVYATLRRCEDSLNTALAPLSILPFDVN